MSNTPELFYFDGPGRANLTRLAFVAAGVDFTDTRVDDWPSMKSDPESVPSKLFGQMPAIKQGDQLIAQSIATACHAAEQGLWKRPSADRSTDIMVACANEDLRSAMYGCLFGDDDSKAAAKNGLQEKVSSTLAALERMLERSTVDGPFFFATTEEGPSLADLAVYDNVRSPFPGLNALAVDLTAYPKVVACAAAVAEDEKVKAFAANGFK